MVIAWWGATAPVRRRSCAKSGPGSSLPGGKNGIAMRRLLAALLVVGLHEVFGVRLEHLVDLVEQIIQLGLDLLALRGVGGRFLDLFCAPGRSRLLLQLTFWHGKPPSEPKVARCPS